MADQDQRNPHIEGGKVNFGSDFNVMRFREWCKEHEGARLRIEHVEPVRSMSQHRFYWVYLEVMSQETGHTTEELHAWAKRKFLPHRFATVYGQEVELEPSTTTLKKAEFSEYLERICAETGVALPDPSAAGYISNY
jgi:hypothetical protein